MYVLCLIVNGWEDKRFWSEAASRAIVQRLIDLGLVGDGGPRFSRSFEVEFSLGLRGRG